MTILKQLPACQVQALLKDNLENSTKRSGFGNKKSVPNAKIKPLEEDPKADVNAFGSEYNAEFARKVLKEHKKMSVNYKTIKLINKIEERGSLYGKSAAEVSEKIAELRAHPEIQASKNMFTDNQVSEQYEGFQKKAAAILRKDVKDREQAAEEEYQAKSAIKRKNTLKIMKQKTGNDDLEQTSQVMEAEKQKLDLEVMTKKSGLVMGK